MSRAIVIGAGPAGSSAAIGLARAGWRVNLVESRPFPRIKVCGEFVCPAGAAILERLVEPEALIRAGARRIARIAVEIGDRARAWTLPRPGWSLGRGALDELLRDRAADAGAEIVQPVSVRRVEYGAGVRVELAGGGAIEGDVVIHADGAGRHDPSGATPIAPGLIGCKCAILPGGADEDVRIRAGRGGYVGTIQVEGGLATCALAARAELVRAHAGDLDSLARALWPGFDPARRASAWVSCGVPRSGWIAPGHARSFRVGNAAAAVDPVGGEGIGLALWSGCWLSRALARWDDGERGGGGAGRAGRESSLRAISRELGWAYRRRLRTRAPVCRWSAAALSDASLRGPASWMLSSPTLRAWACLTGKCSARAGA